MAIERLLLACDFSRIESIIYRCPQAALAFGTIALALKEIHQEQHAFFKVLNAAISSPLHLSISRPEFREFEALWLAARMHNQTIPEAFSNAPRTGILFRFTHASFLRREDMYAKTHMAMYMTDFGAYELTGCFDRTQLSRCLDHDLAWAFGRADWDLVGELSMTSLYCSNRAPSPWQSICHLAMDAVFEKYGCVPMPTYDDEYSETLRDSDRKIYLLFHSYHTTIVYGLLLLARSNSVEDGSPQPVDIPTCEAILSEAMRFGDFAITGSGLDSNWFEAKQCEPFQLRNDLVAEIMLSKACENRGVDRCLEMADLIDNVSENPLIRETIEVLSLHRQIFIASSNLVS